MTQQIERRIDPRDFSEVKSTAEKALTLMVAHEKVCTERYGALKEVNDRVAAAFKYIHIGIGMCLAVNTIVGLYVMVHR